MKKFLQFNIPFAGLKEGMHRFQFEINAKFFEQFEVSFVKKGQLVCKLDFFKKSNVCTLDFYIKGTVETNCDRCLEPFDLEIDITEQLLLKFSPESKEVEEIIYLLPGTEHFNIAQYIYEFISLAVPIKCVHPDTAEGEPGCPPETLAYLDPEENDDDDDNDNPIWGELQKFKE